MDKNVNKDIHLKLNDIVNNLALFIWSSVRGKVLPSCLLIWERVT